MQGLYTDIEHVRNDLNYSSTDIKIFLETRFSHFDHDNMYAMQCSSYQLVTGRVYRL